jgi:hypothetical protein
MIHRRKGFGPGFISLFIVLLCAGSTWGSEAVSDGADQPAQPSMSSAATANETVGFASVADESQFAIHSRGIAVSVAFDYRTETIHNGLAAPEPENLVEELDWKSLPIVPELSDTAYEILQAGLSKGNSPRAFSVIGDCQSFPPVFMGIFDTPSAYELTADEGHLEESIAYFSGSFARVSASVNNGFSVASVFSPLWANHDECRADENPLECEFRIQKPILVFINLGTNWQPSGDKTREQYLREIVEYSIEQDVLPILSTKGDNFEGNHSINEGIANIAIEYDIPLWNFWRSIQYLPQHGIDMHRDGNYLSVAAWNKRSYSGLRMLHVVYSELLEIQAASLE